MELSVQAEDSFILIRDHLINILIILFKLFYLGLEEYINHICLILCRLYNYGIGIHLIENPSIDEYEPVNELRPINPKDNHISFQVRNMDLNFKKENYKLFMWMMFVTKACVLNSARMLGSL